MDQQKKKKFHSKQAPKLEVGAVLATKCPKCGGEGTEILFSTKKSIN
jgi:hypothetical protein